MIRLGESCSAASQHCSRTFATLFIAGCAEGFLFTAAVLFGMAYVRQILYAHGVTEPFRVCSILFTCLYFLGIVALIWAPETKGRPLPED